MTQSTSSPKQSVTLSFWSKGNIERIFVNALNGDSLGFFEMETTMRKRGVDSYYDRHRIAKGDLNILSYSLKFNSDVFTSEFLLNELNDQRPEHIADLFDTAWNGLTINGREFNWFSLAQMARNGYPSYYGNDPKAVVKSRKHLQATATYSI